jgi:DNA polymerase elongation subunit (family B)
MFVYFAAHCSSLLKTDLYSTQWYLQVRKGVLPRLLEEILSTRITVKQAMKKLGPSQQVLKRVFTSSNHFSNVILISKLLMDIATEL